MRSFDKRRGVLGKWAIVIMMALVLAFLASVAPVSGAAKTKYCSDTCGKSVNSKTSGYSEWDEHVRTKICKTSKGTKYLVKDRHCEKGNIIKICHHRAYCPNTGKCAETTEFIKNVGKWKHCDPWDKYYETV